MRPFLLYGLLLSISDPIFFSVVCTYNGLKSFGNLICAIEQRDRFYVQLPLW
jgi:hypothetical protein